MRTHGKRTFFGIACLCLLGLVAFLGSSAPSVDAEEAFPGQGFLPDNRAWELVSPPDKAGGDIIASSKRTHAAANGNALSFTSLRNFGDSVGGSVATEYIAERSAGPEPGDNGWSTHAITPPQEPLSNVLLAGQAEPHYTGEFSPNLDAAVFKAFTPLTADPDVENALNLYVRRDLLDPGAGEYRLLTACPACAGSGPFPPGSGPQPPLPTGSVAAYGALFLAPYLAGASRDLSHVIFESRWNLTADAPPQPECSPSVFGGFACVARLYESADGTVRLAGILPDGTPAPLSIAGVGAGAEIPSSPGLTPHTISDGSDGHSRIFFTVPTDNNGNISAESRQGDLYVRTDATTSEQLNASERTDCAGDPSCGGDGIPDPASTPFRPATYLDASADGERVFLMTNRALTDDAPNDGEAKIYMYETTKPGSAPDNLTYLGTRMVGMIGASADGHYAYLASNNAITLWQDGATVDFGPRVEGSEGENLPSSSSWFLSPKQSRVTPDGRFMLYRTTQGTGFSTLYLYSADTNQVTCVSCNPDGAPVSQAASDLADGTGVAVSQDHHENHALSDDGRYVFFSSDERLVARDINGVSDAYEFDTLSGKPHLLSSGESSQPSYFIDASADGSDVFISTVEPLSGWDVDGSRDIYGARVGGGFPEPSPPPPSCQGDACQPNPTQLNDPTPASSSFKGQGNQKGAHSSRCAKGQRRVKARSGKTRCAKRRHHRRTANHNRRTGR